MILCFGFVCLIWGRIESLEMGVLTWVGYNTDGSTFFKTEIVVFWSTYPVQSSVRRPPDGWESHVYISLVLGLSEVPNDSETIGSVKKKQWKPSFTSLYSRHGIKSKDRVWPVNFVHKTFSLYSLREEENRIRGSISRVLFVVLLPAVLSFVTGNLRLARKNLLLFTVSKNRVVTSISVYKWKIFLVQNR